VSAGPVLLSSFLAAIWCIAGMGLLVANRIARGAAADEVPTAKPDYALGMVAAAVELPLASQFMLRAAPASCRPQAMGGSRRWRPP
jgi:hypothetical protein